LRQSVCTLEVSVYTHGGGVKVMIPFSFEHDVEQIFEQQGRLDAFTILSTSRPFHQVIVGRN
jgi:hypothetical protein